MKLGGRRSLQATLQILIFILQVRGSYRRVLNIGEASSDLKFEKALSGCSEERPKSRYRGPVLVFPNGAAIGMLGWDKSLCGQKCGICSIPGPCSSNANNASLQVIVTTKNVPSPNIHIHFQWPRREWSGEVLSVVENHRIRPLLQSR